MSPKTIAVIGALDADLIMVTIRIPDRGESVCANHCQEALRGKGANSVIATYRTCHQRPLKMIRAVGDDRYGESICFVMVEDQTRENRCLFMPSSTATWREEDFIDAQQLGGGTRPDLVLAQMEIHKEVVETMLMASGKAGIDFCLKAAPAIPISKRLYRHLTHLLVNESEAAIMSGRERDEVNLETWPTIAQEFLSRGIRNVVITLGAKGAFYANAEGSGHCPAFDVQVEDTTGAGDAFAGAYASDYMRQKTTGGWDNRSAVVGANKVATITFTSLGVQEGIPWSDNIDNFDAPVKRLEFIRSKLPAGLGGGA
ncbi:ribokinase [Fusarium redolens]|uniref:Ribokinase n=1 Tax=Fusarium redolens TaxID=48865 RepID=A0A9P9KFF6_FUSRE|nr:ribokinase [Fusarium redolens]KAH7259468.1 ribokinase [Fusarium redolens]